MGRVKRLASAARKLPRTIRRLRKASGLVNKAVKAGTAGYSAYTYYKKKKG